jgi:hypothetical protein
MAGMLAERQPGGSAHDPRGDARGADDHRRDCHRARGPARDNDDGQGQLQPSSDDESDALGRGLAEMRRRQREMHRAGAKEERRQ